LPLIKEALVRAFRTTQSALGTARIVDTSLTLRIRATKFSWLLECTRGPRRQRMVEDNSNQADEGVVDPRNEGSILLPLLPPILEVRLIHQIDHLGRGEPEAVRLKASFSHCATSLQNMRTRTSLPSRGQVNLSFSSKQPTVRLISSGDWMRKPYRPSTHWALCTMCDLVDVIFDNTFDG